MHLGIIGYGTIAGALLDLLHSPPVRQVTILVRPSSADAARRRARARAAGAPVGIVTSLDGFLAAGPDLAVECAGHGAVAAFGAGILAGGTDLVIASLGALADQDLHRRIENAAQNSRARAILPSGAIGGLDLLAALEPAGALQVDYRGIKPPGAWKGTPAEEAVDLDTLVEPTTFFTGTARDAALAYPKNANVVAALALAGGGFDRMRVELIADPTATGNRHSYEVASPLCRYAMVIEAAASAQNARTSATTVYSIFHQVRSHASWREDA